MTNIQQIFELKIFQVSNLTFVAFEIKILFFYSVGRNTTVGRFLFKNSAPSQNISNQIRKIRRKRMLT